MNTKFSLPSFSGTKQPAVLPPPLPLPSNAQKTYTPVQLRQFKEQHKKVEQQIINDGGLLGGQHTRKQKRRRKSTRRKYKRR